jgi:hypothetical protein
MCAGGRIVPGAHGVSSLYTRTQSRDAAGLEVKSTGTLVAHPPLEDILCNWIDGSSACP